MSGVIGFGKHVGRTWLWVAEHDPRYLDWLATSSSRQETRHAAMAALSAWTPPDPPRSPRRKPRTRRA